MNRRSFLKSTAKTGMVIVALPALGSLQGCTVTTAEIVADGNAVANALLSLSTAIQATNPTLSADLKAAATTLQAATANWTTGSTTAYINDAAAVVEAVLATIPMTAIYAPLVAIAVAALDVLIANLPSNTASAKMFASVNPYRNQNDAHNPIHHRIGRSPKSDFIAAWNKQASKIGLVQAEIR